MIARLFRFLRRADDWFAERVLSETVPFSPVCCPPAVRCEVAGRADSAVCRPATPPTTAREATR